MAVYSATSRGRVQLIYNGQPFIFEKILKLPGGEEKKYWRCNQWWNQKCRSRVYSINDMVIPLNRYHTHEEIVKRKKRTRRIPPAEKIKTESIADEALESSGIEEAELNMHLKYEEIVADATEMVMPSSVTLKELEKRKI